MAGSVSAHIEPLDEETTTAARVSQILIVITALMIVAVAWAFDAAGGSGPGVVPAQESVQATQTIPGRAGAAGSAGGGEIDVREDLAAGQIDPQRR